MYICFIVPYLDFLKTLYQNNLGVSVFISVLYSWAIISYSYNLPQLFLVRWGWNLQIQAGGTIWVERAWALNSSRSTSCLSFVTLWVEQGWKRAELKLLKLNQPSSMGLFYQTTSSWLIYLKEFQCGLKLGSFIFVKKKII